MNLQDCLVLELVLPMQQNNADQAAARLDGAKRGISPQLPRARTAVLQEKRLARTAVYRQKSARQDQQSNLPPSFQAFT